MTRDGSALIDAKARYWPRIAIFAYPCTRRPLTGVGKNRERAYGLKV